MKRILVSPVIAMLVCVAASAVAQRKPGYLYDEEKIAPYTLLDPLSLASGQRVTSAAQWNTERRPELLHLFEQDEFGVTPTAAKNAVMHARVLKHNEHALGGTAIREQIELTFDPAPGVAAPPTAAHSLRLLLYVPANAHHPSPLVLGPNFGGNSSVVDDPGIQPTAVWSRPAQGASPAPAPPPSSARGKDAERWQIPLLLSRGYAIATFYYGDLEPDLPGMAEYSVRRLYSTAADLEQPHAWGALAAWAWGLSRCLDYLQLDPLIDGSHVAVTGHSRLGKAADWAAAQDTRFSALLSTESGHGGQTIQRRGLGETVAHLADSFPYWFAPEYARWKGHDAEIPVDGNLLLSLIAPRPLYVASAAGDEWSDPHGEFLSTQSAARVYRLFDATTVSPDGPAPAVDQPVGLETHLAYHDRSGPHDVRRYDWEQYLRFLDSNWGKPAEMPTVPPTGLPPRQIDPAPASTATVDEWRRRMDQALYIPSPLPSPAVEAYSTAEIADGVTIERISYQTAYGLRVPAVVYRPARRPPGRMPGIVVVNGHGGDKTSWYAFYTGVLYARAGAVVLTYDPIGEGERNDDHRDFTREHDELIPSPGSMPVRLGGLMVTDVMQAVSTLTVRPDVDPSRIGVMGFSMGSFIASLAGSADPRVHALLLVGGGDLDGPDGYWDSGHAVMCQAAPYKALLPVLGDRGAALFTLSARRGDTFIVNGTADAVVAIPTHGADFFNDLRQRVVRLNGSERGVFTTFFDPGAGHRPSWITPSAAGWLNQELHFPVWQGKDVRFLPTIRISEWAQEVRFDLGEAASHDNSDGGIQAIAAQVPRLTADQLDVLPREKWQARKADFVYSSWLQRASAAAAAASRP
ncbi:glucuronyl esterase domain-containing protein [Terriglobus aquaticus]|uniref:4-O-methyl-glucuronoyl methylesterase-like domain-containing protein n=1 Tax=Terriglobus aquaticus TaxID=940139 RepID=A0ABW9KML6_9BACT|nr:hypothetical protein [Terriglobus aquaticus]